MKNYNIVASNETQKQNILNIIKTAGAILTAVSGYGSGYYIQLDATPSQADAINTLLEASA